MKALLINPGRSRREPTAARSAKRSRRLRYHSGLYSISAALEARGFQSPVLDLEIEDPDLEAAIKRERPDIVGITASTANRFQAIDAAKQIKQLSSDMPIVVGGPHFTFTFDDTLRNVPEIDIVVRGEGEVAMQELMQSLAGDLSLEDIAGISFSANGEFVHNSDRVPIRNLDELQPINWESIPWKKYDYRFMNMPCVSMQTSRGCPINCTFCSVTKMWGKHLRWKSPEKVVDEIEYLLHRFGFEAVFFDDDTFTLNRRHLLRICEEIERRELEFRWVCQARVDTINKDILATMKHAGCCYIYIGVETGSQKMLDTIHKKITREQVLQAVRECGMVGIMCHALFMYSLPGETDEDRRQTFELMEELIQAGVASITANATIIYPGTQVEETARKRGVLPPDFSWSAPFACPQNEMVQPGLAHTPLYSECLSVDDMLQVKQRIDAMQRPLQATLRLKESHVLGRAPRYLWSFTEVRSKDDLKKRITAGRDSINALVKLIKLRRQPRDS